MDAQMASLRQDIFHIPPEYRHLPEAAHVLAVEAEFEAAVEREKKLAAASGQRVWMISEDLQRVQRKLQQACDAFDAAAGLTKPAPLTPRVMEELDRLFSPNERDSVRELLEKRCGRTIPFERDADPLALEPYRLCVLRQSKGDTKRLREWIAVANVVGREILSYEDVPP